MYDHEIKTVDDVVEFFKWIHSELKINFHPDDDFQDYIETAGLTESEADELDGKVQDCFRVCETHGEDICELALELLQKRGR